MTDPRTASRVPAPRAPADEPVPHPGQVADADPAGLTTFSAALDRWKTAQAAPRTPPAANPADAPGLRLLHDQRLPPPPSPALPAVDAFPGLGKTTAVLDFALKYHRQVIEREGAFTAAGHERWPVCRVGLTSNIGMKEFNRSLLEYYAHPGRKSGTAALFAQRALDCVLQCETRILVIDDLHFLKWHDRNGTEVSNHFKYIANEFPVTIIFIGVELAGRGLYSEANSCGNITLAQTARRTTPLTMEPFVVTNDKQRREWRRMLLALEKRIVLCRKFPGMLADELSDYLYIRTTGHIGSLMTLINRGCQRAARTGVELLDAELLDQVKLDAGAERARKALAKKFARGRMTTKPRSRAAKAASAKTVA